MKIAVIGATGKAGHLITEEAQRRGHTLTAFVRQPERIRVPGVAIRQKDIFDLESSDLSEFDAVINAFGSAPGHEEQHQTSLNHLIRLMGDFHKPRLLMVGGAASLYVDETQTLRLFDTPEFPDLYKPVAGNMLKGYLTLADSKVNWTYLSPAAHFDFDGPRTGRYQLGGDNLILNEAGESYVSYADFATAMIDEVEQPQHICRRFTVVSEGLRR